jgi:hypothetical protein
MTLDIVLAVWAALGAFAVLWTVVAFAAGPRVPLPRDLAGFFLRSWLGRGFVGLLWAELGWHIFCQRP